MFCIIHSQYAAFYFSRHTRSVRVQITEWFPFLISSFFSSDRFADRNKFFNRPPTPKNCLFWQSSRAGGRVACYCLGFMKLFSRETKAITGYLACYCLGFMNVLTLVHTLKTTAHCTQHKKQHTPCQIANVGRHITFIRSLARKIIAGIERWSKITAVPNEMLRFAVIFWFF